MLVGHQPKEFLLSVEALTVSFDGFKAVNDLSFAHRFFRWLQGGERSVVLRR
jgi:ABC-type uncharacterized transport system ATPase subunit